MDKIQICPNELTFAKPKIGIDPSTLFDVRFSSLLYSKVRIKRLPWPLKAIILGG